MARKESSGRTQRAHQRHLSNRLLAGRWKKSELPMKVMVMGDAALRSYAEVF